MRTAFLFPGQGAQFVGMGKDVAEAFPEARKVLERAGQITGIDIRKMCFEGPADQLNTTAISQPAILAVSAAILEVLRTERPTSRLKPDAAAGLSMGEYTALYAAGLITLEDALRLVKKRGEAMQAAANASSGGMVAIIGLDEDKVRALCNEASHGELLEGVNFNCPGQIAISGTKTACERAEKLAQKYGAAKAIRLDVAGAFHTQMMAPAAEALSKALMLTAIEESSSTRVIANINAEYYTTPDSIRQALTRQLTQPIFWQKCMERLIKDGVQIFYEIGPGKVLTGLMKRINRKANIINVSNIETLHALLKS